MTLPIYDFRVIPEFKELVGVVIFLFGMLSMKEWFKAFTGGTLEPLLRKPTDKYWKTCQFIKGN